VELNNDETLDESQKKYRRRVIYQAEKVINMLKLPRPDDDPDPWDTFIIQTNELDVLRNESFAETFPELEELYKIKETKITKKLL
jgi:hypothetical protein